MVKIDGLFETHLTVSSLERAVEFYRDILGLSVASIFESRRVAFFWLGASGKTMLGLWETGTIPQKMVLHTAFTVSIEAMREAVGALKKAGIAPLDFQGKPTSEPVVLCWMPAASLYFQDPDGNLLEFLAMLPDDPRPELGVAPWSEWPAATS